MVNMLRCQCVVVALVLCLKGSFSKLSECGRAPLNIRTLDGDNASEGAWPWQVSIQNFDGHFCGGSLVNRKWVVTSAQCFPRKEKVLFVNLGIHALNGENSHMVTRFVKKVIIHPNYNATTNDNDIALVKLDDSVKFSEYVRPVCLAGQGSKFREGNMSYITGFNNTVSSLGVLQEIVVPITKSDICDFQLGVGSITANMLCAGYINGGPDTCQGDLGGPLVTKLGVAWILTGISSWGRGCTQHNSPAVYTLVSNYQIWISSIIKKNLPGFVNYDII